jgi:serine/threonine-protein kinase
MGEVHKTDCSPFTNGLDPQVPATQPDPDWPQTIAQPPNYLPPQVANAGPEVPGYDIVGELGRGGTGVVYKARQLSLNRVVALKMVLSGVYAGEEERQRFVNESRRAAAVKHPNIVQVFDSGAHRGHLFYAMELLEGGSLAAQLGGRPQPPIRSAELVEALARAVQTAHAAGIIHRDLKPANIFLAIDGTPKIGDFGLAKQIDHSLTATGAVMGSPSYMAPEQASGATAAVGPGVDVYALGAVLYELLVGKPPFRGVTAIDTMDQVRSQEPVPPSRLQPTVPRDLERICLKCLSKDPRQRYASAGDVAEDLRRFVAGEPILARPPSFARRVGWWCCHRDRVRDAGFFTVCMILVVAVWAVCGLAVHAAGTVERGAMWPLADSEIPSKTDLAVVHFMGVLGGLFLPLLFTGLGAIRGKASSLWAGLVISAVNLGLMLCCLAGVDSLLWLIDLGGLCGTRPVRFFAFGFPVVLFGLVVAAYGIALVAYYQGWGGRTRRCT